MAACVLPDQTCQNRSVLLVFSVYSQDFRLKLQTHGVYDARRKIQKVADESGKVAIPVLESKLSKFLENCDNLDLDNSNGELYCFEGVQFTVDWLDLPFCKKFNVKTDYQLLCDKIEKYFHEQDVSVENLIHECPRHWEKHGNLILFPGESFVSPIWDTLGMNFWQDIAKVLRVAKLAKKSSVSRTGFRTPQVRLLLGENGWVEHIDNGIRYTYDVTKCMFSAGNITEKLRIARMDCSGETVVDLYAGIGYFTLPYLVHAGASMVHACEWNPDAITALRQNLRLNGVEEKCVIHQGDNREVCPKNIADRVNLGLIPSSTYGWPVACAALKKDKGGMMHIHCNVTTKPTERVSGSSDQDKRKPCIPKHRHFLEDGNSVFNRKPECAKTNALSKISCSNIDNCEFSKQADAACNADGIAAVSNRVTHAKYADCEVLGGDTFLDCESKTDGAVHCLKDSEYVLNVDTKSPSELLNSFDESIKIWDDLVMSNHESWTKWTEDVFSVLLKIFQHIHGQVWTIDFVHLEHVKSYAPHVDHLVLDVCCRPPTF